MVSYVVFVIFFFFFKQKTAYEMRISDWSSDVCSSDLAAGRGEMIGEGVVHQLTPPEAGGEQRAGEAEAIGATALGLEDRPRRHEDPADLPERRGVQPAERRLRPSQFHQFDLAQHRQGGQRRAPGHRRRIYARQGTAGIVAFSLGVGDLPRTVPGPPS